MKKNGIFELLKDIGKAIVEQLPEIIEPLPVCGKLLSRVLKAIGKGIENFHNKKKSAEEKINSEFNDAVKEEASQTKTPVYMDSVIFRCKSGCTLSYNQKNMIDSVFVDKSKDTSGVIRGFILDYMDDTLEEGEDEDDDYFIDDDYVSLNFHRCGEYRYNEEVLNQLRQAINDLIGCDALDYFVAYGHDESHNA